MTDITERLEARITIVKSLVSHERQGTFVNLSVLEDALAEIVRLREELSRAQNDASRLRYPDTTGS